MKSIKYKTIYLDPPWKICTGGKGGWGTPQNHYPVMYVKDIIKNLEWINDVVDDQAHMYLWVVNNKIEDAFKLIKALGFTYITNLVWVKDRYGLGQYFRGQHELCFFCRKGSPLPYKIINDKRVTIPTVVIEPRDKHSKKPHRFYDIIEQVSYGPFLEVYARNERDGWDSWGPHENINTKTSF